MTKSVATLSSTSAEIPTETHLVMLCLDYLMDLRRHNDKETLDEKKHLDADFISLAVFALSRSIVRPDYITNRMRSQENIFDPSCTTSHTIPHITKINEEIMNPLASCPRPYDKGYNDLHPSNLYRFYRLEGLAAGGPHSGPLRLTDLVDAGLKKTNSRCRLEAEKGIVKSTQFELYIQSVTNRGYFRDNANAGKRDDPKEEELRRARKARVYKERYRKAIAKYREKLALNIDRAAVNKDAMTLLSPPTSPIPSMVLPRSPHARSPDPRRANRDKSSNFSSPPRNSPSRSNRAAFSPPRTFHRLHTEGTLSPLTIDATLALENTAALSKPTPSSTPRTPKSSGAVTLKQSRQRSTTPGSRRVSNATKPDRDSKAKKSESSTKITETALDSKANNTDKDTKNLKRHASESTIATNPSSSSSMDGKSADFSSTAETPERFASSFAINPCKSVDTTSQTSTSTMTQPQNSPRSTLAKMASRRKIVKVQRESPLGRLGRKEELSNVEIGEVPSSFLNSSKRTPRESQTLNPRGFSSPTASPLPRSRHASPTPTASSSLNSSKRTPREPQTLNPRGFSSPTASPLPRSRHASPTPTAESERENKPPLVVKSGRKPVAPEIEVKVKAFSLYELNLLTSASSGLEANAGSFASSCAPSISRQRRKSEYERMIEEQKRSCLNGMCHPEMESADCPLSAVKGKPRPMGINTSRGKDEEIVAPPKTPKHKTLPNIRPTGQIVDGIINHSSVPSCRSPLARMRREKETIEELNKIRYGSAAPKNEDISISSPRKLKPVGSNDDSSWISSSPRMAKAPAKPLDGVKEQQTMDRLQTSTVTEKAAVFQPSGNVTNHRFTFKNNGDSPSFSPRSELKLDPFRITPPSFLGGSKLFVSTVGESTTNASKLATRRLSSPKGLASPRGVLRLQSPQNNFNNPSPKITRAC
jgi:hypothetical protein